MVILVIMTCLVSPIVYDTVTMVNPPASSSKVPLCIDLKEKALYILSLCDSVPAPGPEN